MVGKLKDDMVLGKEAIGDFLANTMARMMGMIKIIVSSTHSDIKTNDISITDNWAVEYLTNS
jgi:hypothetical protein